MIKRGWKRKTLLTTESLIFKSVPPRIFFVHQAYKVSQSGKHQAQWSLRILPFRFAFFFFTNILWVLSCSWCFTKLGRSKRWIRNVPCCYQRVYNDTLSSQVSWDIFSILDNFLTQPHLGFILSASETLTLNPMIAACSSRSKFLWLSKAKVKEFGIRARVNAETRAGMAFR